MVLPNKTEWISSQLLGCLKVNKFGLLIREHLHHVMSITALLLVWPVDHMEPHMIDWVTTPGQVLGEQSLIWVIIFKNNVFPINYLEFPVFAMLTFLIIDISLSL